MIDAITPNIKVQLKKKKKNLTPLILICQK